MVDSVSNPGRGRALHALRLSHYRNYAAADLTLDGRPVALTGPNGAGKTNILEAISCLAPGRGLRRAATADITRRAEPPAGGPASQSQPWAVSADLAMAGVVRRLGVGQDPAAPSRRLARIDGEATTHAALGQLVRISWLTPAQDRVFAGPRADRLRFFDRLTLALHPRHGATATAYERALRERVRLLAEGGDPAWLHGLEAEMARHGAALAVARADMATRLQAAIDTRADTAFPKADIALDGVLEQDAAAGADEAAIVGAFQERLAGARARDAAAGRALEGPHRTDLATHHRAKAMPAAQCSTGEQKALLVGLSLAHAQTVDEAARGAAPLLLLDEAAAHLDDARREALADEICGLGAQAWLTGTDERLFDAFAERAQRFHVEDGAVSSL